MSTDATTTKNADAALCRSTGKFATVLADLEKCTTSTESDRNQQFAGVLIDIRNDIRVAKQNITDALLTGDAVFGQYGSTDIAKSVQQSNTELEEKKKALEKEIANNEAVIERSNRDFSDVKNTLPDRPAYSRLHFIEDYTVFFLLASYLFMVILCGYLYVLSSEEKWTSFIQVSIVSLFGTLFLGLVSYYLI